MKSKLAIAIIAVFTIIAACRKERTCACKIEKTTTKVTTPRSSGTSSTTVISSLSDNEFTYSKITKHEMKGLIGCNTTEETSVRNFSTNISTSSVTTIGSNTFMTTVFQPADVEETMVTKSDCDLK